MAAAGRRLAKSLAGFKQREDVIVLSLVRGGVPVGAEVARELEVPMDVILLRRLLAPQGPDRPVCAVRVAGHLVEDEELGKYRASEEPGLRAFLADAEEVLAQRERACRGTRPPAELAGKTVLLVDNGIRSGRTLGIALRAVRRKSPACIAVAVPVADPESAAAVRQHAEELIVLEWRQPFGHVGLWYREYKIPEVEEIGAMLKSFEGNGS